MLPSASSFESQQSRRRFLAQAGGGFGSIAPASLLSRDAPLGASEPSVVDPLAPRAPHFLPRAKRVVYLFMHGGPSHVDLFDPKPELARAAPANPCPSRSGR